MRIKEMPIIARNQKTEKKKPFSKYIQNKLKQKGLFGGRPELF